MIRFGKVLFILMPSLLLGLYAGVFPALAFEKTDGSSPFRLKLSESRVLRDPSNRYLETIPKGAIVELDPGFLKTHLGSEAAATSRQAEDLVGQPESLRSLSKTKYVSQMDGRTRRAYFFPVKVRLPDGKVRSGKMALKNYKTFATRSGSLTPRENGKHGQAEGGTADCGCADVVEGAAKRRGTQAFAIDSVPPYSSAKNELFDRFKSFMSNFMMESSKDRPLSKANSGMIKHQFLIKLAQSFSKEDSIKILRALTAFQEAPSQLSEIETTAHMAAILKVIANRVAMNHRASSSLLASLRLSESFDTEAQVIFSDVQFSCWNSGSSGLVSILGSLGPHQTPAGVEKMRRAFETVEKLAGNNQITFLGKLASDRAVLHYSAVKAPWTRKLFALVQEKVVIQLSDGRAPVEVELKGGNTFYGNGKDERRGNL